MLYYLFNFLVTSLFFFSKFRGTLTLPAASMTYNCGYWTLQVHWHILCREEAKSVLLFILATLQICLSVLLLILSVNKIHVKLVFHSLNTKVAYCKP